MKYKNNIEITYLNNPQKAWYANECIDRPDLKALMANFKLVGGLAYHSFPIFFIIDYTTRQYLLITESVAALSGYHAREFLEVGLEKLVAIYHQDDFNIFNKEIFPRNVEILGSHPQSRHNNFTFIYTYRILKANKKSATVLQRGTYFTSPETGLPLYSLGVVVDVSELKTDTVMMHSIQKADIKNGMHVNEIIETNYFYPNEEDTLLSKREKDVLRYMADGLSSKMIADKLKISENTIVNHRQNMLRKTNTKNVAQLIAFAIRSRII